MTTALAALVLLGLTIGYVLGYVLGWATGYRARETEELGMYQDTRSALDRQEGVPERRVN